MPTHDVDTRRIVIGGSAIALAIALVIVAVFLLLRLWGMPPDTDRVRLPGRVRIEGPALQSAPQLDLARYRAEKQRLLDSGAWLDASHQHARMPIAAAMGLLARVPAAGASHPERQP
ncbi:MAG TPA: hypothetical protein VKD22_16405 [Ramlibacter sp.]|nr:hypothetical protein [Ramlibacter sp.]